jgi:hypothetical protein
MGPCYVPHVHARTLLSTVALAGASSSLHSWSMKAGPALEHRGNVLIGAHCVKKHAAANRCLFFAGFWRPKCQTQGGRAGGGWAFSLFLFPRHQGRA